MRVGTFDNIVEILVNDTQTILKGDIIIVSSGKASLGADGTCTDGVVLGTATHAITTTTATATDILKVDVDKKGIYRFDYAGSSKTSLAATDLYDTIFDVNDAHTVDLDDTTGGCCIVVDYDNTAETCDVILINRVAK